MLLGAQWLKKAVGASVAVAAMAVVPAVTGQALAQDQNQGQAGGGGQGGPGGGRGNFDPAQFRQRINERMKEFMGASDEEWMVIQPKLEKVMDLQRQTVGGRGMGALFRGRGGPGGGGGPGGPGGGGPGGDPNGGGGRRGGGGPGGPFGGPPDDSPVSIASRELQKSVENNASADELKAKLATLREARAKAREDLTKAQNELRELLTMKQEAALVMMGMLE